MQPPLTLAPLLFKMATFTGTECACCVLWFSQTKSANTLQHNFHTEYGKDTPDRPSIYFWHQTCVVTRCTAWHAKSTGCPQVADAAVKQLRKSFACSPKKLTWCASCETGIQLTVWHILCKHLHLTNFPCYKKLMKQIKLFINTSVLKCWIK